MTNKLHNSFGSCLKALRCLTRSVGLKILFSRGRRAFQSRANFCSIFKIIRSVVTHKLSTLSHFGEDVSHVASIFFRRIFESRYIRTVAGLNLAILTVVSGFLRTHGAISAVVFLPNAKPEIVINEPKIDIATKKSVIKPLERYRITQGFTFFHPAIDLGIDPGKPIHPVMNGIVTESQRSWVGYGNTIVVDHQNGYSSRYAHLSSLFVKLGEKVSTDTVLGLSGSTGRSSGPHLHLEIADRGIPINPRSLLE